MARQRGPQKRRLRLVFPTGGLNRKAAYRQQKPYTTADCLNVRPSGLIEGRERGGVRPGLIYSHQDDIGSNPRLLASMTLARGNNFSVWSDTFGGTQPSTSWTQASWATDMWSITDQMAAVDTSVADADGVLATLSPALDATQVYTVEALLVPYNGAFHGTYSIYIRLDNTTPAWTTDGVKITVTMTGTGGVYTGVATSYTGGVKDGDYTMTGGTLSGSAARPVWLIAQVTGDALVVTLDGTQILSQALNAAQNGLRVGLGMETTVAGGANFVSAFRVQYTTTGDAEPLSSMLVASAGGDIYSENRYGRMTVLSSSCSVRSDVSLTHAQLSQKLYIADYGNVRADANDGVVSGTSLDSATYADWTTLGIDTNTDVVYIDTPTGSAGTFTIASVAAGNLTLSSAPGDNTSVSFRIERAPKIYDPINATLTILTADSGEAPTGCPIAERYLDCLFLAGAETNPGVWYLSAVGDPLDWNYSATVSTGATSGTAADAGVPPDAITAAQAFSDDYLIIGCRSSLWRMRGHPRYGGSLDNLSHVVGIVGRHAKCMGPGGEMIFLSLDGIYALPAGGESKPVALSREVLPLELHNFNPDTTDILMEYDHIDRGIHIMLTPKTSDTRTHWWLDWETGTFWPVQFAADHEPTAMCAHNAIAVEDIGIILGGRDGKLRRFNRSAANDTGTAITNYIDIGPFGLTKIDGVVGKVEAIDAEIAADSGSVTWALYVSDTFEGLATASAWATGTFTAGINYTVRPGGRGQAAKLRLTGPSNYLWSMEQVLVDVVDGGPRRRA